MKNKPKVLKPAKSNEQWRRFWRRSKILQRSSGFHRKTNGIEENQNLIQNKAVIIKKRHTWYNHIIKIIRRRLFVNRRIFLFPLIYDFTRISQTIKFDELILNFIIFPLFYRAIVDNYKLIYNYRNFILQFYLVYLPALAKESTIKMMKTPKNVYNKNSSVILLVFSFCCSSNICII